MGSGPTYVDKSASQSAPYLTDAFNTSQRGQLDLLTRFGQPEMFTPNVNQINEDLRLNTEIANLRNKQFEEKYNPKLAAARSQFQDEILGLMDLDTSLKDEYLKLGLADALQSGTTQFGEGDVGDAILQNIFGRNYLNQLQQNLELVGRYLDANEQQVTLNPSEQIGIEQDSLASNVANRNAIIQRLLGTADTQTADALDFGFNINEGLAKEGGNLANIRNANKKGNPLLGALSGAVSGAGTGFAAGGPMGALIGGVAGGGLGAMQANQPQGQAPQVDPNAVGSLVGLFTRKPTSGPALTNNSSSLPAINFTQPGYNSRANQYVDSLNKYKKPFSFSELNPRY